MLYDDIAFVIRHTKKNMWLKAFSGSRSYWVSSLTEADICTADQAREYLLKLSRTSHSDFVQLREVGLVDS